MDDRDTAGFEISPDNKVRVYACPNWNSFLHEVRKPRFLRTANSISFGDPVVFRGHANPAWALSSTLERTLWHSPARDDSGRAVNLRELHGTEWYAEECTNILNRFQASARGLNGFDASTPAIEQWIIGRHHGLLSPYLDWTRSPFVAAFFALSDMFESFAGVFHRAPSSADRYVSVWALRDWSHAINVDFVTVVGTTAYGTRARAQQSAFTFLNSKKHVDLVSYLTSIGNAHSLERYDIKLAAADASAVLIDLERMNVNYLTLFPDMLGAALSANINMERIIIEHGLRGVNSTPRRQT